jgi:hypothetical protein
MLTSDSHDRSPTAAWTPAAIVQMAGPVGKTAVFEVNYKRSETPVQETLYPMKVAYHPDNHQPLAASPDAPKQAICPHCDGRLTLRRRQRMDGGYAYFWRHLDHSNRQCNGRSRPARH